MDPKLQPIGHDRRLLQLHAGQVTEKYSNGRTNLNEGEMVNMSIVKSQVQCSSAGNGVIKKGSFKNQ